MNFPFNVSASNNACEQAFQFSIKIPMKIISRAPTFKQGFKDRREVAIGDFIYACSAKPNCLVIKNIQRL